MPCFTRLKPNLKFATLRIHNSAPTDFTLVHLPRTNYKSNLPVDWKSFDKMFSNLPDTKYEDGTKWEPSVLSTFSDMLAGGDPLLRTINLKANQENEKTLAYIVKETLQHKLASMHYGFINTFCIFAPTMLITFLSAAISIFSTSEIVKDADVKVWLGIAVALLQLVLSILYVPYRAPLRICT